MSGFPGVGGDFGPYSIVSVLGRGGMGVVFEATDRRLDRAVALKVLSPVLSEDPQFRSRFAHEAGVLAKLDSPHVVQIFEYGEIDDCLYLAAQLIRGGDLKGHLQAHGPIPPALALDVAVQVAEALVDASELGVVHRDIKPSNILLRRRGAGLQAYLCDFGIAWTSDSAHTRTGQVVGSIPYMPPEQHEGRRADIRSDVYALGCVLWDALSGRPPYQGTDIQVAMAHINQPVPQLPGDDPVTAQVNRILLRALAKDPDDRYQTPEELHAVLSGTLAMARAAVSVEAPVKEPVAPAGAGGGPVGPVTPAVPAAPPAPRSRVPRQRPRPDRSVPTVIGAPTRIGDEPRTGTSAPEPTSEPAAAPRRRRRLVAVLLAGAIAAGVGGGVLALTGPDKSPGPKQGGKAPQSPAFAPPIPAKKPSTRAGGTIRVGYLAETMETDPGKVYTPAGLNAIRLTSRSLMFERETAEGAVLVPDLATGPGAVTDGGRTWTYHLRPGLKYSNGQPITARDVAYGVLRVSSTDRAKAGTSPYLGQLLNLPPGWDGEEKAGMDPTSAVEVLDATTIVFHLNKPFYEFDSLMALPQAAPVPRSAAGNPMSWVSSGPYRSGAVAAGNFTLVRNRYWKRSEDPNRPALPDRIEFRRYDGSAALENAVKNGIVGIAVDRHVALPTSSSVAVRGSFGLVDFLAFKTSVAPLANRHCRRALAAALDTAALAVAFGGAPEAGQVATTLLPPGMPGRGTGFDLYGVRQHPNGNLSLARSELAQCSSPDGFEVNLGYVDFKNGGGVPANVKAIVTALSALDVTVRPIGVTADQIQSASCGSPVGAAARSRIGICLRSWAADWWSGYGFLAQIADPGFRLSSYNFSVTDPEIRDAFKAGLGQSDPAARQRTWNAIDEKLVADALMIPLFYRRTNVAAPGDLTNLVVSRRYGALDLLRLGVA